MYIDVDMDLKSVDQLKYNCNNDGYIYLKKLEEDLTIENEVNADFKKKVLLFAIGTLLSLKLGNYVTTHYLILWKKQVSLKKKKLGNLVF